MSDKDFVFRVGPIPDSNSSMSIYYVYPGRPDEYAFPARDNEAAWLRIAEVYDPSCLACELEIMGPATPSGVTPEPHDEYTSRALTLMTFVNLPGQPLRNVQSDNLISDFAKAASDYIASDFVKGRITAEAMTASFIGHPDIKTRAKIQSPAKNGRDLRFVFDDLKWLEGKVVKDAGDEQQIGFGVDFLRSPDFAVDAMKRAIGLDALPMPFLGMKSKEGTPNDLIMLLLISAMTALSYLRPGPHGATGHYEIGDTRLTCFIE